MAFRGNNLPLLQLATKIPLLGVAVLRKRSKRRKPAQKTAPGPFVRLYVTTKQEQGQAGSTENVESRPIEGQGAESKQDHQGG